MEHMEHITPILLIMVLLIFMSRVHPFHVFYMYSGWVGVGYAFSLHPTPCTLLPFTSPRLLRR